MPEDDKTILVKIAVVCLQHPEEQEHELRKRLEHEAFPPNLISDFLKVRRDHRDNPRDLPPPEEQAPPEEQG